MSYAPGTNTEGMRSDSDSGEDLAFLSPPEEGPARGGTDVGASPHLRRSSRKRKSTAGTEDNMVKESSSKKKKSSPKMPKVARSPPKAQAQAQARPQHDQTQSQPPTQASGTSQVSFEALLQAMEGRIMAKLEKASEASKEAAHQAKLNSEGIEQLESRVDENEACLMDALVKSEARIMGKVQEQIQEAISGQVREMVNDQLTAAGFDRDLSAADLSVRASVRKPPTNTVNDSTVGSYAVVAANAPAKSHDSLLGRTLNREDRRELNFQAARRSLRLWPLGEGRKEDLVAYLKEKLGMGDNFVQEELADVTIRRVREPRNKNKEEYTVTFEMKQIRDAVKAMAPNLESYRDVAGMRLHIPDHLQKDFQALMNLSYELKKKHKSLKRNIKFDEEDGGLFMDIRIDGHSDWKRIKPDQARSANKTRRPSRTSKMDETELESLLGEGSGEEED